MPQHDADRIRENCGELLRPSRKAVMSGYLTQPFREKDLLLRRSPIAALAGLLTGACLASLAAHATPSVNAQLDPVAACTKLASLTNFPLTSTRITLGQFNPPTIQFISILKGIYHLLRDGTKFQTTGLWMPGHCQVQGIINERIGTDGFQYGDMFEVRLPSPADWNGRFMFQGGGGTKIGR